MKQTNITRRQKAQAIFHLSVVAVVVIGLIICACRLFISCGGDHETKAERSTDNWSSKHHDHREPVRQYPSLFNDLQDTQLQAAQKNGISQSFTREDLEAGKFDMTYIETCRHYAVDPLTHSSPYLVPKAARLLDDIGSAFQDSLYVRGYDRRHRIIVTSVTRTRNDVQRLARQNVNATENSCHCYGTTFDITYVRFDKPEAHIANDDKLKDVLMQSVYDLQRKGRCYVKYERKQNCLHITVR